MLTSPTHRRQVCVVVSVCVMRTLSLIRGMCAGEEGVEPAEAGAGEEPAVPPVAIGISVNPASQLSRGLRILCLDAGGVRGLLELEMLRQIELDTGKRVRCVYASVHACVLSSHLFADQIHELFDMICGCSTGGYLAVLLGIRKYTIEQCIER